MTATSYKSKFIGRLRSPQSIVSLLCVCVIVDYALIAPGSSHAENARALPPPVHDEAKTDASGDVAVFAGGCFWGVQGVFQHVTGVINAVSGYAGGDARSASYDTVSSGTTGHAESVQVTFDPNKISYGRLLQVFFSVAHNPTELNRQGPDYGTQYRSVVFPADAEQERIARDYLTQLQQAKVFSAPIVTEVDPGKPFFPAEAYHQNYLTLHPDSPYIAINDAPKLAQLKRLFPELYREKPALVRSARLTQ
jgi:peptide-methionine (S)-S-oxide reductase